jgi:two-component sensor histidine kinase
MEMIMIAAELSDLLKTESSGIWKWDLDTDYLEFNEVWKNVLGFSSTEIDHNINFWLDLLHPDESVYIMHEVFRCRDGIIPVFRATHRLRKQDKNWITVLSIGTVFKAREADETDYFLCNQFIVDDNVNAHDYLRFHRDLGFALSSTADLSEAVQLSLEAVLRFYTVDAGGVYLLDHETDVFELIEYRGLPDCFVEKNKHYSAGSSMGMLMKNEKTVYFQCDEHSPFPEEHDETDRISINALLPIKHLGKLEAVIFLVSGTKKDISPSVYDEIEGIVQEISGTIGRIRAENRMRISEEKQRVLLEKLSLKNIFETLLIDISIGFIELQGNALNPGIDDALKKIGIAVQADRSYLFQINEKAGTVSNTHKWCAANIEPQIYNSQDIPISTIPWWISKLTKHETISIPVVADLREKASSEKEILEQQNIRSLVVVPIVHGDDLIGFLEFDSVHRERTWNDDIIDLLRIVGNAIGNALERNRMETELRNMYHKADEEARMNAILLREVNHRVKNNLSEIIGLLYAQMRYTEKTKSIGDFVPSLIGRVQGLATVHSMLTDSGWKPLKISELARQIISNTISVKPGGQRIFSTVPDSDVKVNSNQAHSLALIFNELVRNSIKYSLMDDEQLRITMYIHQDKSGIISINYRDNGSGFPDEVIRMERSGLGIDIIKNMILKNLQGELTMLNDTGAVTEITFTGENDIERTDHD